MDLRRFFILFLFGLAVCSQCFGAAQLGDTQEQVEARYGTAPVGDRPKGIAIYRWDAWRLEIHYKADMAGTLIYTNLDPLTNGQVEAILDQNGGKSHWTAAAQGANGLVPSWKRSDGATALRTGTNGRQVTLEGGRMPVPVAPVPVTTATAATTGTSATPAIQQPVATAKPATAITPPAPIPSPMKKKETEHLSWLSATGMELKRLLIFFGVLIALGAILLGKKSGSKKKSEQFPFAANPDGTPIKHERYMVPVMETTTWQHFELLIAEVYRRKGYQVEISSGDGADGGLDLRMRLDDQLVLAQCKSYLKGKVAVTAVREFYGVMIHEKADRGIFFNTNEYTSEALSFAVGKPMELLDKDGVRALVESVTKPGENIYDIQRWLPQFLREAVVTHPDCPFCKKPMVLRDSKNGRFWGCASYPQCQGKRDARLDLIPVQT